MKSRGRDPPQPSSSRPRRTVPLCSHVCALNAIPAAAPARGSNPHNQKKRYALHISFFDYGESCKGLLCSSPLFAGSCAGTGIPSFSTAVTITGCFQGISYHPPCVLLEKRFHPSLIISMSSSSSHRDRSPRKKHASVSPNCGLSANPAYRIAFLSDMPTFLAI